VEEGCFLSQLWKVLLSSPKCLFVWAQLQVKKLMNDDRDGVCGNFEYIITSLAQCNFVFSQ